MAISTTIQGAGYLADSTARMGERLQAVSDNGDPLLNPFLNRAAVELFRHQLDGALSEPPTESNKKDIVSLHFKYAYELLHSGQSARAIDQFKALRDYLQGNRMTLAKDKLNFVRMSTIMAFLRLGEQENCIANHTTQSCIVPIEPEGFHQLTRGSRGAIQMLLEHLKANPNDLRAGWLLNLAYMTLGEHPDKVPGRFRIPERVFASEYDIQRFNDVSHGLGLDLSTLAGGVVMDDFDNDHDLDLLISGMGLHEQMRFFRNNADGTFTERTAEAGLIGEVGGLNMVQADYNNDGYIDVFILRGAWFESQGKHPNSLIRNNGDGTFDDVTEAAGLLSFHPTQAATWLDFNNDGWIDLFVANETTEGAVNPCEMFRNNGDGSFTECAAAVGIRALGLIKAVHSGDFNNDGWPDLYLSCRGQPNLLYQNNGPQSPDESASGEWRFTDVGPDLKVTEPGHSFPSWFFDYDNDGWLDLFSCGYGVGDVSTVAADYLRIPHSAERPRLYRNNGDGTFEDVTKPAGLFRLLLGMSGNFGDLDNDGFLDLYLGTGTPQLDMLLPNRMMRNNGTHFQDVTTSGGFGQIQKGHAIAFGDMDHDGDQDIYTSLGGAYEGDVYFNALYENPGHGNAWLKLKLVGAMSNRAGIGARIRVRVTTDRASRDIHKTVNSGGSFGASPLRQEIGLSDATAIESVEIWWPASGMRQRFDRLKPNHYYLIRENSNTPQEIVLKPFSLKGGTHARTHKH